MFGIGTGELLVLLVLALLVLGPDRMPKMARDIGRTVGDLRRTSDDLRREFLNADAIIDKAAAIGQPIAAAPAASPTEPPAEVELPSVPGGAADLSYAPAERLDEAADTSAAEPAGEPVPAAAPEAGITQAEVVEPEPDETAFDKEARLARERLDDPERAARAKAEGWTVPTDEAGTNPERWG